MKLYVAALISLSVGLSFPQFSKSETIVVTNLNSNQSTTIYNIGSSLPNSLLHEEFLLPIVQMEFNRQDYIKIEIFGDPSILNTSSIFREYRWYGGSEQVLSASKWGRPFFGTIAILEETEFLAFPEVNSSSFPFHNNYFAPDFYEPFYSVTQIAESWSGEVIPIMVLNNLEINKDVIVPTEPPYLGGPSFALLSQTITGSTDFKFLLVPEPSSLSLLLAGGAVFAAARRRKAV